MISNDKVRRIHLDARMQRFAVFDIPKLVTGCQRQSTVDFFRDVGVAGSNPVTPTIDWHFFDVFSSISEFGPRLRNYLVQIWSQLHTQKKGRRGTQQLLLRLVK
jgi:hypothetical protein